MTRFFCGWKHYEPCAEGFCIRGECPEIPAEQSLAVEATENHGPEAWHLSVQDHAPELRKRQT
jgi:hypothetical protein